MTRTEALAAFVDRELSIREARAVLREIDEASPLGRSDAMRAAMGTETKLAITYTRKRDGVTGDYVVRPYEVKPHPASGRRVLYAQDHKHGGKIHAFLLSRIEQASNLTRATFSPTWPTQPASV